MSETEVLEKTRINQIAKDTGLANKALVAAAQGLGLEVKSHSSSVAVSEVERIVNTARAASEPEEWSEAEPEVGSESESEPVVVMTPVGKQTRKQAKQKKVPDKAVLGYVPDKIPVPAESSESWGEGEYAGLHHHDRSRAVENACEAVYVGLLTEGTFDVDLAAEAADMGVEGEPSTREISDAVNRVRNRCIKGGYFQDDYPDQGKGTGVFAFSRSTNSDDDPVLTVDYLDYSRTPRYVSSRGLTAGPGKAALSVILGSGFARSDHAKGARGEGAWVKKLCGLFHECAGLDVASMTGILRTVGLIDPVDPEGEVE